MRFIIEYDLSSYLGRVVAATSKEQLSAHQRSLATSIESLFSDKMVLLELAEEVMESCAVANLHYHFRELAKNSIDAFISNWFKTELSSHTLLSITIDIESESDGATVIYRDNASGFDEIKAGEMVNYHSSVYCTRHGSNKVGDIKQLGGADKGLRFLAKNLELEGIELQIGTQAEGGAILQFSSSLAPYSLPTSHGQKGEFDSSCFNLAFTLPDKARTKKIEGLNKQETDKSGFFFIEEKKATQLDDEQTAENEGCPYTQFTL